MQPLEGMEQVPRRESTGRRWFFSGERVQADAGDVQQQYDGPTAHGGDLDGDEDSLRPRDLAASGCAGLGWCCVGACKKYDQARAHPAHPAIGRRAPACRAHRAAHV